MHILALEAGSVLDGEEAIDLGQSAGDIVILSSNDTDLSCLSTALEDLPDTFPSVRLANLLHLKHPLSVDLYLEQVIAGAKVVVVRLLGGRGYWPYGLDEIRYACHAKHIPFFALLDDGGTQAESAELTLASADARERLDRYLREGGIENARNALIYLGTMIGHEGDWQEPRPLLDAGLYWPGMVVPSISQLRQQWKPDVPVAVVVFYRALMLSGQTQTIDALIVRLTAEGLNPMPVYVQSLKNAFSQGFLDDLFTRQPPFVILNATAFSTASPNGEAVNGPLDRAGVPVFQMVFAATNRAAWAASARGLSARDLAMNVALPEVDGRVLAGAVAFKAEARFDPRTQCAIVVHEPADEQIAHVAELARRWVELQGASVAERRVALILANYPNRDARIGNGVGLDTPQSTVDTLKALCDAGYNVGAAPQDTEGMMDRLLAGPTNAQGKAHEGGQYLALGEYLTFLDTLPKAVGEAIHQRWGRPDQDPFFSNGGFCLSLHVFGNIVMGVQPARGYNIDPKGSYHDPALVPPHGYLAFYAWIRRSFGAHAMVHMGKHGNVEWLPGKALALSSACFPQAITGAVPQLYPFIVNDPGEGTQAKRRIGAVIIDHLTPPLTRAETYGALRSLETLVDEYYMAAGMDSRRIGYLRDEILALAAHEGLDVDGQLDMSDPDQALGQLDNYLCDLKEMQIRDGLHVFGKSPEGRLRTDLLVALARVPRGLGQGSDGSLIRGLADDLGLEFDPLDCRLGDAWHGARPEVLARLGSDPWRNTGDTVERLERLAQALVEGQQPCDPHWHKTKVVLEQVHNDLAPRVDACGRKEMQALLQGLEGRFVQPGPSGAPTRGRPEVLPTGRNFFSVDTRAVPTPTAWKLGWTSAQLLVEDYLQREGEYPSAVALSAWGTSNMRTGGDDIAQAMALMGVRPQWELSTGRVTGFEVLPLAKLGRPRVDVTIRVSGFFRDAFAPQIDLLDAAARAIQQRDEAPEDNPAAALYQAELARALADGHCTDDAVRKCGARVYGSMPGAYGAGLQALIDEKIWDQRADLANTYIGWGHYAYGGQTYGHAQEDSFRQRLSKVQAVIQNQDNREHDLLDSDDYYQFEGGLTAAVEEARGQKPLTYHNDHSRPETPRIRTLEDEIGRTLRARLVNPKWISGVMRHGYKGGFEMAASIDYLFAFAATTDAVKSHHFDLVFEAFVADPSVTDFLSQHNADALKDIADRLMEAIQRGLWQPRSNSAQSLLETFARTAR